MNTALALKIERALDLEEGFFMILQVYHEIKEEKRKHGEKNHPDLSKLRPGLFWDTDINKIDWQRQRKAVIQRVFERGSDEEKHAERQLVQKRGREHACVLRGRVVEPRVLTSAAVRVLHIDRRSAEPAAALCVRPVGDREPAH